MEDPNRHFNIKKPGTIWALTDLCMFEDDSKLESICAFYGISNDMGKQLCDSPYRHIAAFGMSLNLKYSRFVATIFLEVFPKLNREGIDLCSMSNFAFMSFLCHIFTEHIKDKKEAEAWLRKHNRKAYILDA